MSIARSICFVLMAWLSWPQAATQAQATIPQTGPLYIRQSMWLQASSRPQHRLVRLHWNKIPKQPTQAKRKHTPGDLGVIRLAHHFEDKSSANMIFLFGILPVLGIGDLIALGGGIYAACSRKDRIAWGSVSVVFGTLTMLGLVPFFAEAGFLMTLIPLVPALALLTLGVINLILAHQPAKTTKTTPKTKTQPHKVSMKVLPWVSPGENASVQGGLLVMGRF